MNWEWVNAKMDGLLPLGDSEWHVNMWYTFWMTEVSIEFMLFSLKFIKIGWPNICLRKNSFTIQMCGKKCQYQCHPWKPYLVDCLLIIVFALFSYSKVSAVYFSYIGICYIHFFVFILIRTVRTCVIYKDVWTAHLGTVVKCRVTMVSAQQNLTSACDWTLKTVHLGMSPSQLRSWERWDRIPTEWMQLSCVGWWAEGRESKHASAAAWLSSCLTVHL